MQRLIGLGLSAAAVAIGVRPAAAQQDANVVDGRLFKCADSTYPTLIRPAVVCADCALLVLFLIFATAPEPALRGASIGYRRRYFLATVMFPHFITFCLGTVLCVLGYAAKIRFH